jgi:tRNA-splicing ligase RtcB (3'-phosphate/5'-hydroxy nucleic acid ligase)
MSELRRVDEVLWEIPASARPDMRVPARVFADTELLVAIEGDRSLEQLQNVATLPGIVDAALAMPDVHQGYGFPVGGVAATAPPDGVVSPGGVGYDINCGVRLLAAPLSAEELGDRRERLVHEIARAVPAGAGGESSIAMRGPRLDEVLAEGPRALVRRGGIGTEEDVELTESGGRLEGANPAALSDRARERGGPQLGTLGSGNHFVELQRVDRLHDAMAARAFGLRDGQVTVLIHSGSRGLGHQVCTDFVKRMDAALGRHGIRLPDRQLSCAPVRSPEGRDYLAAMAAAANFAWANRQAIAHRIREAVRKVLGDAAADEMRQVYDVAHNVAKLERHGGRDLCVHRKGATRAFPPGSREIPGRYREAGQPVFIPGSMGTASYVLAGRPAAMERSFGTVCHGAGRSMSRTGARKRVKGADVRRQLEERGIVVRSPSNRGLAEEAPFAYKDVEKVVEIVERAGLAVRVTRLRPIGVIKG